MLEITTGQLEAWLAQYLWPFLRIGACFMMAPIFGASFVPPRVRLFLAGAITLIVAPLVPPPANVAVFSFAAVIVTIHQLLIGFATAFALQLIFDALAMGGQLLANTMGLGFAFNVDPLRGVSTPVLGQLYMILVTLTFLAINGHLVLIEIFVQGFTTLPVGLAGLSTDMIWRLVEWGSQLFAGALTVALPGMAALLVVNLAFGVMSRAAPTLNLFAVGFPITLIAGLIIMYLTLPSVMGAFAGSLEAAFGVIRSLLALSP
ncbi:flagellar biosynthetic protein FliR [Steroidobacter sp. S1-65]|uniref:Flagellar biosynthetic protein FliR n=1 Tax=Steroidobacter gossypii TaxID=2805490 RepID=A0ABS1X535_9GAMM|nr:flagellar biosynthetic protein FliR [Steroidobacter gossypii]MBM0108341.1 flagellar biosynthetic protein FliR [Steroidobacter gossypii]